MIDKYNIQKLRELDILQVADLLGMGLRNKRALCIHHDDHHPSLAFNVKKNTCHCYSCGFSADTIGLVRERLNLGFSEACRWLADHLMCILAMTGMGILLSMGILPDMQINVLIRKYLRHQTEEWLP